MNITFSCARNVLSKRPGIVHDLWCSNPIRSNRIERGKIRARAIAATCIRIWYTASVWIVKPALADIGGATWGYTVANRKHLNRFFFCFSDFFPDIFSEIPFKYFLIRIRQIGANLSNRFDLIKNSFSMDACCFRNNYGDYNKPIYKDCVEHCMIRYHYRNPTWHRTHRQPTIIFGSPGNRYHSLVRFSFPDLLQFYRLDWLIIFYLFTHIVCLVELSVVIR